MNNLWYIQLLGGLTAVGRDSTILRYKTRKAGAVLAFLALRAEPVSRDVLIEYVWPDRELSKGRHSLRQSLTTLRKQLEPPDVPYGAVVAAEHATVQLNPAAVSSDVHRFRQLIRSARNLPRGDDRIKRLVEAEHLYGGDLLPGYFDDWVLAAREQLATTHLHLLSLLAADIEAFGDLNLALEYALQAAHAAYGQEHLHVEVLRLYISLGCQREAIGHYRQLEAYLREHEDRSPAAATTNVVKAALSSPSGPINANPQAQFPEPERTEHSTPTHHLPARLTRFFGRELELDRLSQLLRVESVVRLVTLVGIGGAGKTRLALEAANRLSKPFSDAVSFLAAEHISEPQTLIAALATAIEPSNPIGDPESRIVAAIGMEPFLLVLDNCEQFSPEAELCVARLLQRIPSLRVLATSRRALQQEGETIVSVTPLPIPLRGTSPQLLLENASVRLFVDRAQSVNVDFQITPRNAMAIAELCERLEGIPLAIELAAARAQMMTPFQMNAQLAMRFDFLVSKRRSAESRHRTLRAAIDWSFSPLSQPLKRLFSRLSIFRGSFSLEAVMSICTDPDQEGQWMLADLVGHNLVQTEEMHDVVRFRLLETMRDYAKEHIDPGDLATTQQRYCRFFGQLAEQTSTQLRSPERNIWLTRMDVDLANLRYALELTAGTPRHVHMSSGLWRYWLLRGLVSEGLRMLHLAIDSTESGDSQLPDLYLGLGILRENAGQLEAANDALFYSRELCPQQSNSLCSAQALNALAVLCEKRGEFDLGCEFSREAIESWQKLRDRQGAAAAYNNLARLEAARNNVTAAIDAYRRALSIYQELKDRANAAVVMFNIGATYDRQGKLDAARAAYEESLDQFRLQGNQSWVAIASHNLGDLLCRQQDPTMAKPLILEALSIANEIGDKVGISFSLTSLANVARLLGSHGRAVRLHCCADMILQHVDTPRTPIGQVLFENEIGRLREVMTQAEFNVEWERGKCMTLEQAVLFGSELAQQDSQVYCQEHSDLDVGAQPGWVHAVR